MSCQSSMILKDICSTNLLMRSRLITSVNSFLSSLNDSVLIKLFFFFSSFSLFASINSTLETEDEIFGAMSGAGGIGGGGGSGGGGGGGGNATNGGKGISDKSTAISIGRSL